MKFLFKFILSTLTLTTTVLSAEMQTSVEFGAGIRHDTYRVGAEFKDVSLNATFIDTNLYTVNARGKIEGDWYYARLKGEYAWTTNNHVFNGLIWCGDGSHSSGKSYELTAAAGYPFLFQNGSFQIVPVVGYSLYRQEYSYKWHSFSSHERYSWFVNSPFIGVDMSYKLCNWTLFTELEYHFVKCEHMDWGHGFAGTVGIGYHLTEDWTISLCGDFKDYRTAKRSDDAHFDWKSYGARIQIGYAF